MKQLYFTNGECVNECVRYCVEFNTCFDPVIFEMSFSRQYVTLVLIVLLL